MLKFLLSICCFYICSSQYADFTHKVFLDFDIRRSGRPLIYPVEKRIDVSNDLILNYDRFFYKGVNYSSSCFPIFKTYRKKLPGFEDCTHYYEFIAVNRGARFVKFSKCEEGTIFDRLSESCVPGHRSKCLRDLMVCADYPRVKYVSTAPGDLSWLKPEDQTQLVQRNGKHAFYYNGHHYFKNCFPIFITKVIGRTIPDPLSCNRYYEFDDLSFQKNISSISLKQCGANKEYVVEKSRCVWRERLPSGCTRKIKGCEGPIETGLVSSQNRRTNVFRYDVSDDLVKYPGGAYFYQGKLYDHDARPLYMNATNNEVPDPKNCHFYYRFNPNTKLVDRVSCSSSSQYYNFETRKCEIGDISDDCHPEDGNHMSKMVGLSMYSHYLG